MFILTEEGFDEFIKSNKRAVVKAWQQGCQPCTDYAPVFETVAATTTDAAFGSIEIDRTKPSAFRRAHLVFEKGEPSGSPTTLMFEDGKLLRRVCGLLTQDQLRQFIAGTLPPRKKNPDVKDIKSLTDTELKALIYDLEKELVRRRT